LHVSVNLLQGGSCQLLLGGLPERRVTRAAWDGEVLSSVDHGRISLQRKTESEIDLTADKSRGRALTAQAVTGFLWMFSGAGAQAVLKIAVLAVLARLLTPVEFGIVSAALVVVALAELFGRSAWHRRSCKLRTWMKQ
jgi:hypothetical protein